MTIHQYTLFTLSSATGGAMNGEAFITHRESIRVKRRLSLLIFAIPDAPRTNQRARLRSWFLRPGLSQEDAPRPSDVACSHLKSQISGFIPNFKMCILVQMMRTIFLMTRGRQGEPEFEDMWEASSPMPCSLLCEDGRGRVSVGRRGCQPGSSGTVRFHLRRLDGAFRSKESTKVLCR